VQVDSSLHIVPSIAKSWEISEDGKVYTFHLRNDVFFHNDPQFENGKGRKATAQDFVYSFHRIMDPAIASRGAWIFNGRVDSIEPFFAIDDSTFQLKLKKPFPPMLGILTMQYCSVVPKEVCEHYGKDFRIHPVGTGPFKLKVWKEGVVLLLFKNENYFERDEKGNKLPYLDAVRITFLDSKATEFLKFRQHEYDFMSDVDPSFKDDVLTKEGELQPKYQRMFRLQKSTYLNTEYIGFNLADTSSNNPLRKKEVRQAINYAIDKDKMMLYLRNNIGIPARHGFVPPGITAYDTSKVKGYMHDVMKARELVYKAGYSPEHSMPEIKLLCTSTGEVLANFIVNELKQANINASIETMQSKALNELMVKGEVQCFRASWIGDYPDAENFLALFYSGYDAPPNYTRFKNAAFDKGYETAFTISNDSLRNVLYEKLDSLVMEEAPVCPLYYDQSIRFIQNNVSGLVNNPLNLLDVKRVKIE
jgi:peptide/nickel transport system substrate-binding protein